jgi:hypothetical protein
MTAPGARTWRLVTLVAVSSSAIWAFSLGALGPSPAAASDAASQAATPGTAAMQGLATCVAARHQLLVDFLIDTSRDLRNSDPGNGRVGAAQAALVALRSLETQSPSGTAPNIQVAVDGFADSFQPAVSWTGLNAQSLISLKGDLGDFATRSTGVDADYYLALQGAKQELDQQSAAMTGGGGNPPCEAIMWFTGGRYRIEPRDSSSLLQYGTSKSYAPGVNLTTSSGASQAVAEGTVQICSSDGLADQMHEAGIVLVAFQLTRSAGQAEGDFLQSIATGTGGTQTCGEQGSATTGAYIPSYNLSDLAYIFDQAVQEIGGGVAIPATPPVTVCPSQACSSGEKDFVIPNFIYRFHLLLHTGARGVAVVLRDPQGTQLSLPATGGTQRLGSTVVQTRWVNSSIGTVDVQLPPNTNDWTGTWSVFFVDPNNQHPGAQSQAEMTIFGDVTARLLGKPELTAGSLSQISIGLVTANGKPASVPAGVALVGAVVTDPTTQIGRLVGVIGPDANGDYSLSYLASPDGATSLNLLLEVTVSTDGIAIRSTQQFFTLSVNLSAVYPHIEPSNLEMSSVLGHQDAHTRLTITSAFGGCVAFRSVSVRVAPVGVGRVTFGSHSPFPPDPTCLRLSARSTKQIELSLHPSKEADGEVQGAVDLVIRPSVGPSVQRSVPFEFSMRIPLALNPGAAIWLLLAGIIGPLLLLYVLNYFSRRFGSFDQLRYIETSVEITGGRESVVVKKPDALVAQDASIFNSPDSLQNFEISRFAFRVHMSRSPLGAVTGRVAASPDRVITNRGVWRGGTQGVVPLGLGSLWVAAVPTELLVACVDAPTAESAMPASATLLILLNSEDSPEQQLEAMAKDAVSKLPALLEDLLKQFPSAPEVVVNPVVVDEYGLPPLPGDGLPPLPGDDLPPLPDDGLPSLPGDDIPLPGDAPTLPDEGSSSSEELPTGLDDDGLPPLPGF